MNIIENNKSPIDNAIVDNKQKFSNSYPFNIEIFQNNSYINPVRPYSISPRTYFANIAKYTETAARINVSSTNNNLYCAVCGDISSGKHYGILACNGCSGFFKRSVRRKLIYRCQVNSNMCIIDKVHRNQCQACRFKKCLQMGMIKEAVQNERQPRNNLPYDDTGRLISHPSEQTNIISGSSPLIKQKEYDLVNHLDDTISSQILLMIIKWIHNLPTFLNLSIHDQIILMEESWSELFLLWIIQYSISFNNEDLIFRNVQLINDVFDIFKQLKVNPMEFTCLKAIVLFRFDIRKLKEMKIIENLQDQALITLAQITKPTRFGRLLLMLPLLRIIPSILIEKTYFSHLISDISISKLVVDMFRNV